MENLKLELIKETNKKINDTIERFIAELKESQELTHIEKYTLNRKKPYVRDRVSQVKYRVKEIYTKELNAALENIDNINKAFDKLPNDLVLTINFYKNTTWGWCPRGTDNYGHKTESITGCGYCKESTATAQLLNQNAPILKRLYALKDQNASQSNSDAISYGAGHGILPRFEGGVGVGCHVRILEKLGYKVTQAGNNDTTILIISEGI